jgi:hypothetical protein
VPELCQNPISLRFCRLPKEPNQLLQSVENKEDTTLAIALPSRTLHKQLTIQKGRLGLRHLFLAPDQPEGEIISLAYITAHAGEPFVDVGVRAHAAGGAQASAIRIKTSQG